MGLRQISLKNNGYLWTTQNTFKADIGYEMNEQNPYAFDQNLDVINSIMRGMNYVEENLEI